MANGIEVAKAYVTIVPSLQGSQSEISSQLTGITNTASEQAGEESGKTFGASLAKGLKTTGAVIAGAMTAVTASAVATGKAFVDATAEVASYGDTVAKESAKMHISSESYQELDFILQHYGSSIDVVKNGMKTLTAQAESGSDAFEKLGISQEEVANLSQEDLFYRVVEGLQGVTDESERTVLAQTLLGRSSVEMTNLFNASSEDVENLREQCHELGGVLSDDVLKDAEAFQDELQNMNTALDGMKRNMMSNFLPGITEVMRGLSKVFSGDSGGIGEIKSGLQNVINNISALLPEFLSLAQDIILALISGFAPMIPQLTQSLFSVIIQTITILTSMIPQMMPSIIAGIEGIIQALFEALPVIVEGLGQLITSVVTWLSTGDNVTNFVNGLIELATQIVEQIALLLPILLPAVVRIIAEIAKALTEPDNIMMIINAVILIIGSVVVALVEAFPEIVNLVVGLLENAGELLGKFVDWIKPFFNQMLTNLINTFTSWGNNIKNFVTNLTSNIKNAFNNWLTNLKNGFVNAFNYIRDKVQNITNKVKEVVTNVIEKIKELPEKVVSIGRNLVEGLWNGINDKIAWVKNKIYEMGDAILNAIKGIFGIASPSKEFAKIGDFLAQGLAIGYEDGMDDVKKEMLKSSNGLTASMTTEVSAYTSGLSSLANGSTTNYNGGSISINVYGAEGQNVNELARVIADKLEDMTRRKGLVYG